LNKLRLSFIALIIVFSLSARAASVDTVSIYSDAMKMSLKCVVIKPDSYKKSKKPFPVVYLLHGYGGWYANWLIRVPSLKEQADLYQVMIVCPDGKNSWYVDSPIEPAVRFETYVAREIPAYIDSHYKTVTTRFGRAITGLSMGGHGGLFLGFKNAAEFGACGSMSGGVDMRPFPGNWEISKNIGDSARFADNWKNYSVINVIDKYPSDSLAIIIDCGVDDFFIKVNRNLHEKMVKLKIPHDYTEHPGQHDWAYWGNAVKYQLLFFYQYFKRNNTAVK
jgi:S-formylglutathione hydrolase FrmB